MPPVKVIALGLLGLYAFLKPGGDEVVTSADYLTQPFSRGLINGYLTMDTLAALVFSLIVVNAIRGRGVSEHAEITKYTVAAALIASAGLVYVYISLFYLGVFSHALAPAAANGAEVLQAYISATFGYRGGIGAGENEGSLLTLALYLKLCVQRGAERTEAPRRLSQ